MIGGVGFEPTVALCQSLASGLSSVEVAYQQERQATPSPQGAIIRSANRPIFI